MDSEVKPYRSLPPLVEGKVHGYLKLTIDEIVWSREGPGEVTVLASWWGEEDCALFRPTDIKTDIVGLSQDNTEVYTIKTNALLFREYMKNCKTIQLTIYLEDTHEVIGKAQVGNLLNIFHSKPYFKYVPILSNNGHRIGEIHVSIKLLNMTRDLCEQSNEHKFQKKHLANRISSDIGIAGKYYDKKLNEHVIDSSEEASVLPVKMQELNGQNPKDIHRFLSKIKRKELVNPLKKYDTDVTDKLVAQVIARAQRLRGAILKEADSEDAFALGDNSDGLYYNGLENENRLFEYFLGKEMSQVEQYKALNTLKSISPTESVIDLASKAVSVCKCNNMEVNLGTVSGEKLIGTSADLVCRESSYKDNSLLNRVDSIRIFVESLTLTSAGFRRVKSSVNSRIERTQKTVTYFIQYDSPIDHYKQAKGMFMKNKRPIKIYSKQQIDQTIYFDYEAVHSISKSAISTGLILKFKILHRHLNQKLPSELGTGAVSIKDVARSSNFCSVQRVAIVHKGIKTGDLKVTIELGCDCIHFGKQYIDAVMSTKENIPVLEIGSLAGTATDRYRNATGTQSKTNSRVSSTSTKKIECLSSDNDRDLVSTRNVIGQKQMSSDDNNIDIENPETEIKNKVLLHGLIYIAEGHDLPQLNTFLICRAFWREDKASSKVCTNTNNPVYNFCQLVPLIHGADLLERIKDNYIVIEVHSKNSSGEENLLGIAKLSVHQLYVAYRDPLVLPHLLVSQYPVISVDGWVPINDPITGQSGGELLALVALGTAEQITRLEMTRGLRESSFLPQTVPTYSPNNNYRNFSRKVQHSAVNDNIRDVQFNANGNVVIESPNLSEIHSSVKSQKCQTDISTLHEVKNGEIREAPREEIAPPENSVLHALVDRLAQALNIPRTNTNQSSQTDTEIIEDAERNIENVVNVNTLALQSASDDSDIGSPGNHFEMPTEIYRSVGVGAEFDEIVNPVQSGNYSNPVCESPISVGDTNDEQLDSHSDETFRALIEIECALHLPHTEKLNESIEPCTYVTFQKNSQGYENYFDSYVTTNVFPSSCDPKWDWKCDTKLSTQLLRDDTKRLILKVWRLVDPDINRQIDLERDVVIGFSAIDLSVLLAGFPVVSGWFHIIDFTGKCNGQMKVNITPLDNLTPFLKSSSVARVAQIPTISSSQSSSSPSYSQELFHYAETNKNLAANTEENKGTENQIGNPSMSIGYSFDNVSMSLLSDSLKQKLTELDEITKRLQLRLSDVTSTAFEDDFDNDFDLNEPNNDTDQNKSNTTNSALPHTISHDPNPSWQTTATNNKYNDHTPTMNGTDNHVITNNVYKSQSMGCNGRRKFQNAPSVVPSLHSICNSNQNMSNGFHQHVSPNDNVSDSSADYPVRGTKTHISYLLDKLTLQFPTNPVSPSSLPDSVAPFQRTVIDLLNDLRQNNNNSQDGNHTHQRNDVRVTATQTENSVSESNRDCKNLAGNAEIEQRSDKDENRNLTVEVPKAENHNKISEVLKEELIREDNNDTVECDELTSYLMTSNVRHMDLDDIFNPLLYQHLVPHLFTSTTVSPEGEAVQMLDNRYTNAFCSSANNSEASEVQRNVTTSETNTQQEQTEFPESTELFRLTPSGISENIDGNIDLTVIHKPSNNDLMAGNSTESTTTISFNKSSESITEVDVDEVSYSTSSESPVSTVSRQAPDGGNPAEENSVPTVTNINDSQESSSSS